MTNLIASVQDPVNTDESKFHAWMAEGVSLRNERVYVLEFALKYFFERTKQSIFIKGRNSSLFNYIWK